MHTRLRQHITQLFLFMGIWIGAQQYPVKLNPVLMPPYSVRLADYATSTEEKVRLQLLLTDLLQPSHKVNLRFSLESASSSTPIAATNPAFNGMRPFTIYPGTPLVLSNLDFRALFELQNLTNINAAQYSRPLDQGMYNFCFTAFDAINNQQLSQKSCAPIYLQSYEPPFLTLPGNAEKVTKQNEFQNIIFQWMPRQEAPNTQYIFTLKEIWDTSINPSSAFLASRTLWQEKVNTRSVYYGMDKTALLEGRRYAWQVQAVSANQSLNGSIDPNDYNGVYQNNGLSEIFYFDYVRDCVAPIMLMAKNSGRGRVEVRWMMPNGQPQGLYNVQYRLRGSTGDWADQKSYQETAYLTGLQDHTEYEYRVGSVCGDIQQFDPNPSGSGTNQNAYTYSQIQYFTTNSDDKDKNYQCGVMPDIDITNKTPLTGVLSPNQTFMAGDFTVTVLKASGNGGSYSGEGFIVVPYLMDTKVKVVFNNIQVNSDKKLIGGVVETTYDPTESAVSYASTGLGELFGDQGIGYKKTTYKIGSIEVVSTPPPGKIIIHGTGGSDGEEGTGGGKEELPLGKDYEITDEDGNVWYVDEKGNVTKGGKVAEGGASTSKNTDGVTGSGKNASVSAYTAKGVSLTWDASKSEYAYDDANNAPKELKSEYPKLKDVDGKETYVSYKAVANKSKDTFDANISITDNNLTDRAIIFKTLESGKEIKSSIEKGTATSAERTYRLNLEGTFSYATEQVIAVLMPKAKDSLTKQQIISSFNLVHLEPKTVDVSLVPLDQSASQNLDTQAQQLDDIYKKVGVSFNIKKEGVLDISSIVSGDTIDTPDDKALSTYSQMQTAINNLYKGGDRYVLFVTNKKSSTGQNGYMRLNGQFGYVYANAPTKTGAHELGHGAFKLEHPWTKYKTAQSTTDLLMDYGSGTVLNHLDWKQINDPTLKLYTFQSQSAGELAGKYDLDPNLKPIYVQSNYIYKKTGNDVPVGTLSGFTIGEGADEEYFYWDDNEYINTKGVSIKKSRYASKFTRDESLDGSSGIFIYKYESNCVVKYMLLTYSDIKGKNKEQLEKYFNDNYAVLAKQKIPNSKYFKAGITRCSADMPNKINKDNKEQDKDGSGGSGVGNQSREEILAEANQLIIDKLESGLTNKKVTYVLLDKNDPEYDKKLTEALKNANTVVGTLDENGDVKIKFSFTFPQWLSDALPDLKGSPDACAVDYVNTALDEMKKLDLYTKSSRPEQITMELAVAAYRALFGVLYCATSEENSRNATPTGKFITGAVHEVIATVDVAEIVKGLGTMVIESGKATLMSPIDYYNNLETVIKKGSATPKEALKIMLLPPYNTAVDAADKAIQIGEHFIKNYFTECDQFELKDGTKVNMCPYRYGEITVMIVPLVATGAGWVATKVGKIAKLAKVSESLAMNIGKLEPKLAAKGVRLAEEGTKTIIKDANTGTKLAEVSSKEAVEIEKVLDNLATNAAHLDDLLAKYPSLSNKVKGLGKELEAVFKKDFANASEDVIKALDNQEAFNAWKNYRKKYPNRILCN